MTNSTNTVETKPDVLKISRGPLENLAIMHQSFLGAMNVIKEVNDSGAKLTFIRVPENLKVAGHNPQKLEINFSYTSPGEKNFGSVVVLTLSELLELTNFLNGIVPTEISGFVTDPENTV